MALFCFEDAQSTPLSEISLMVGERARTVLWKGTAQESGILSAFMTWDPAIALVEELDPYRTEQVSQRRFLVTGRKTGGTELAARQIGRKDSDPDTKLGGVGIRVRPPEENAVDMVYRGTFLVWHRSLPAALARGGPLMFAASSGLSGSQIARFQRDENAGPLPEADYTFTARVDAAQGSVEQANKRGAKALDNWEQGIQFLPIGGNGPVYRAWGTLRVRLTPRGPTHGRGGFFLHNSHKGFSHGCIEVGKTLDGVDFFATLLQYAAQGGRANLTVRVKYPYPDMSTLGATLTP